jgi:hypothetical protein
MKILKGVFPFWKKLGGDVLGISTEADGVRIQVHGVHVVR